MLLAGAPASEAVGSLAVLVGIGLAFYRMAFALALLAFAYPFDLTTWAGPVKLTTSAAMMAIVVLVWLVRQLMPDPPSLRRTPLDVWVLIFAGATALSLLGLAGNLSDQLVGLLKAAGGFLIFFIATQSLRERTDLWVVVLAVLATGFIQALGLTYAVVTGVQSVSEQTRNTANGTVGDPNLFAGYLVLVIPLVAALGVSLRSRWAPVPTGLVVLVLTVALVATLSRSGWIGLAVGLAALAVLLRDRRWQIIGMSGAILAILLIGGLSGPIAARLGPTTPDGPLDMLVSRWAVWTTAVNIWIDHPIFGVGVANFVNFYPDYSGRTDGLMHAHNIFLNMAAERGILGLTAFVLVLVMLFRALMRAVKYAGSRTEQALVVGVIATFLGYLAHSLFEVSYYDYKILLLFWLMVGIGASLPSVLSGRVRETQDKRALARSSRFFWTEY